MSQRATPSGSVDMIGKITSLQAVPSRTIVDVKTIKSIGVVKLYDQEPLGSVSSIGPRSNSPLLISIHKFYAPQCLYGCAASYSVS